MPWLLKVISPIREPVAPLRAASAERSFARHADADAGDGGPSGARRGELEHPTAMPAATKTAIDRRTMQQRMASPASTLTEPAYAGCVERRRPAAPPRLCRLRSMGLDLAAWHA